MIKIVLYNKDLDEGYCRDNQSDSFIIVHTVERYALILCNPEGKGDGSMYTFTLRASYGRYSRSPAELTRVAI